MNEPTAKALKSALWDTLQDVRNNKMEATVADSVASQAREILRTANTQLRISHQAKRPVPSDLINFSES